MFQQPIIHLPSSVRGPEIKQVEELPSTSRNPVRPNDTQPEEHLTDDLQAQVDIDWDDDEII